MCVKERKRERESVFLYTFFYNSFLEKDSIRKLMICQQVITIILPGLCVRGLWYVCAFVHFNVLLSHNLKEWCVYCVFGPILSQKYKTVSREMLVSIASLVVPICFVRPSTVGFLLIVIFILFNTVCHLHFLPSFQLN